MFENLNVPVEWKNSFTKYPHGLTIFEAICEWTKQVDLMIDHLNLTDIQIDKLFTDTLPENVENVLNEWYTSGQLADLINIDLLQNVNERIDLINAEVAKSMKIINVKSYGAKGDGVTDDTQAIQAAIDEAYTNGGGEVIIPFSNEPYIFTTLTVKSKVILKGNGSILKLKNNFCNDATKSFFLIHNLGFDNVTYDHLIVDGNQSNNTLFTVADLITCGGENSKIINCKLYNSPDSGIMFSAAKNGLCQNNRITNCTDLGIYVNSDTEENISGAIISDNIIDFCRYGGIGIKRKSSNISVHNNTITNCGNGITVEDFTAANMGYPTYISIVGNLLKNIGYPYRGQEGVAERGISISRTDYAMIINNKIINCSGTLMDIGVVSNSIIANNICHGHFESEYTVINQGMIITDMTDSILTNNVVKNIHGDILKIFKSLRGSISNNNLESTNGTGLRVNAACEETIIQNNIVKGFPDFELYSGNSCIIRNNTARSATLGSPLQMGILTIGAGQPLPNASTIKPQYAGQLCIHENGNTCWIATGVNIADWKQISN